MSKEEEKEKGKESSEKTGVTRREFLQMAAAAGVGVAAGAVIGRELFPKIVEVTPPPVITGWMGKILDVDLTAETVTIKDLDINMAKDYFGGRGLGVRIIYDEVGPDVDPLSPENILVFATGPLTGTDAPASGRFCIVSKSPLAHPKDHPEHGAIFDSHSGGEWGPELKFAGFDAIILRGKAASPKYLWIHEGVAELRDASAHWGKKTVATTTDIRAETDIRAKVACIGPAGENLVRIAAVINDANAPGFGRACGRDGGGAVMGSKNLKAIAVRGTKKIEIADPGAFADIVRETRDEAIPAGPVTGVGLPTYGTAVLVNVINGAGLFPTCNFKWGMFKEADDIGGETMAATILTRTKGCYNCNMRCGRVTATTGVFASEGEGPEYETVWSLGAQCGVHDLAAVSLAHYLCNELGLDAISAGSTIGCVMELCKEGHLDLPGYAAGTNSFGDGALLVDLIEKTASREGIGDDLAEGSKRLATKYGAPELSMSVKGLEFPAYDPRGVKAHGLAYATSNRGACHLRAYLIAAEVLGNYCGLTPPAVPAPTVEYRTATDSDKTGLVLVFQNLTTAIDALDVCLFSVFSLGAGHYAKLLSAATGIEYMDADILKVGERIWNLERLYNNREGFTKDDDRMPPRLETEPMPNEIWSTEAGEALVPSEEEPIDVPPHGPITSQPTAGNVVPLSEMLPLYYSQRGWTEEGVPTEAKLAELGLP